MSIPTILDNLIAMVVVLLILSLVVQSIQSGLKKLLKIKSRQIEDSLVDLFEHVLNKPPAPGSFLQYSPILRTLFGQKDPSESADSQVKHLYDDVLKKFRELGRVAQSGKPMLNSFATQPSSGPIDGPQCLSISPRVPKASAPIASDAEELDESHRMATPGNKSTMKASQTPARSL